MKRTCINHPDRNVYEYEDGTSMWCKECFDELDADYREAYQHALHFWRTTQHEEE